LCPIQSGTSGWGLCYGMVERLVKGTPEERHTVSYAYRTAATVIVITCVVRNIPRVAKIIKPD
jgi:hypothetical protein